MLKQLLGVHKGHILGQSRSDVWIVGIDFSLCLTQGAVYLIHRSLQICQIAVLSAYGLLPVPLVHIERVQIVQVFGGANGVHIGVESVARRYIVGSEFHSFPLCKRMYHFGASRVHTVYCERHGMLHAIEVVVDARSTQHKQRCCNAAQTQGCRQLGLKCLLNGLNGTLCGLRQEFLLILLGYY